ncbi:MAG: TonB-dependent receptor [Sediminibacterium sp.]|nr:MAG: TonB-dependent receptor [Sediminibacterium sp.]
MRIKTYLFFILVFSISAPIFAQQKFFADTLMGTSDPIVVTANRSERKLSNTAVPAILISKNTINKTGSLKLQDILQEHTGIILVNNTLGTSLNGYPNPFGQGVQMLGLDPAYTAILLDGEPLVGRNAGILKLGRIATGNIKQIEIVKGPSSSLYGSEAMAGVINILTETPTSEKLSLQLQHASNNTWGSTIAYTNKYHKTGLQFFLNRLASNGYDLDPLLYGKTVDPFKDWNGQLKISQEISNNLQLLVSLRNHDAHQDNNYQILYQNAPAIAKGFTTETERSAYTQLKWMTAPNTRIYFRTFFDQYTNHSFVNLENTNIRFDETSFNQSVVKPEIQFEKTVPEKSVYVAGIGTNLEMINASRYAGKQQLATLYTFTQKEWYLLQKKLTLIAGARLDKRTDFNMHLSPRIAVAYKPNSNWKFTASAGWGFKAPDFRHMYLNFYNAQIGYSLLGNNSLGAELQSLQQQGLLQTGAVITNYATTIPLLPESSFGWHVGASYHTKKVTAEWGVFRNDIKNLIDVYTLPIKRSNGLPIYSYKNIGSVYTEGIEMDAKYQINKHWSLSGGYQFLLAKDKQVLAQISNGQLYKRDPITYQTSLVNTQTYFGLSNRSKHSANGKILYENIANGYDAYFRAIYRGKFGFMDVNGNNIIDDNREMTPGYWLLNMASSKAISKAFRVQIGIEDILNYTNALQLPNIAGRTFFININYSIQHNSKN